MRNLQGVPPAQGPLGFLVCFLGHGWDFSYVFLESAQLIKLNISKPHSLRASL